MKDPNAAVRTAFYNAITALGYPVYDRVPETAGFDYVQLANQGYEPRNTQTVYGCIAHIDVVIVFGFQGDFGGNLPIDGKANAITTAVLNHPPTLTITGFDLAGMTVSSTNFEDKTDTHVIYTRVLRFELELFE